MQHESNPAAQQSKRGPALLGSCSEHLWFTPMAKPQHLDTWPTETQRSPRSRPGAERKSASTAHNEMSSAHAHSCGSEQVDVALFKGSARMDRGVAIQIRR